MNERDGKLQNKMQNIQAKQNCLLLKDIKYTFPLKFIDIIRPITKNKKGKSTTAWV
jgi:hypothetical protein